MTEYLEPVNVSLRGEYVSVLQLLEYSPGQYAMHIQDHWVQVGRVKKNDHKPGYTWYSEPDEWESSNGQATSIKQAVKELLSTFGYREVPDTASIPHLF